eukprot:TRINITY_DN30797_c0_g1_i1.p1 TRINITY_DN30797_c0_g1~~TRINITY_DN30797_c0_g1_i1.p1  ORF type:complete len:112 (-),score=14.29 TRINITY_DN30797_c0_g1_i1:80-415(-)
MQHSEHGQLDRVVRLSGWRWMQCTLDSSLCFGAIQGGSLDCHMVCTCSDTAGKGALILRQLQVVAWNDPGHCKPVILDSHGSADVRYMSARASEIHECSGIQAYQNESAIL